MDFEKMLEKELETNQELKKVFQENPEKKAQYIEKMCDTWDEKTGYTSIEANNKAKYCKTCLFAHGTPPYADLPEKCHCMIFEYPNEKPNEVYFNGEPCEYYEKQKTLSERLQDDILTDNTVLNHNAQCKDCIFRDTTSVNGVECGWQKCYCKIYEAPEHKPNYVYENAELCEYYEKESN